MWTGDKVISKIISDEHLEDINDVLKRKCVIWDNEHANDYDQKRVFMGPYSGRSPEVKSKLSGINKYKYDIDLFEFLQFIVFEICLLLTLMCLIIVLSTISDFHWDFLKNINVLDKNGLQ